MRERELCARRWTGVTANQRFAPAERALTSVYFMSGLYHLSNPSCSCLPAASGVIAPLITCAETFHNSFSRFGVPRDRIWYELRIVDLQSLRHPTIVAARSSSIFTASLLSGKKPGSALA